MYVLANLRTEVKGSVEDEARGLLREWGDMLALVCIILCMMETATRMVVALKTGLRTTRNEVQCLLEDHHQNGRATLAWHKVATGSRDQESETSASGREAVL